MALAPIEHGSTTLELRFKRWTAVGVVCFLGLLAALPFRTNSPVLSPTVAPSHRERSLRFRADSAGALPAQTNREIEVAPAKQIRPVTENSGITVDASTGLAETAPEERVAQSRNLPRDVSGIWTVEHTQNLMDIAEQALGDRRRWRELIEMNPQIRSPFDAISEGSSIVLPKKPD